MDINVDAVSELFVLGFILGEKTIIKNQDLPLYSIPNFTYKSSTLDTIYYAIENSIEKTLKKEPELAITISGGLDSRILAGVTAKLGYDLPAFTFYSSFESKIAEKVCSQLRFKHQFLPMGYQMDEAFFEKMLMILNEYYGSFDLINLFMSMKLMPFLDGMQVKGIVHAGQFNELLGHKIPRGDSTIYFNALANKTFPDCFYNRAYKNFIEYCNGLTFDEISLNVRIQNALPRIVKTSYKLPTSHLIYLDSDVISAIYSIPPEERQSGSLQLRILKIFSRSL